MSCPFQSCSSCDGTSSITEVDSDKFYCYYYGSYLNFVCEGEDRYMFLELDSSWDYTLDLCGSKTACDQTWTVITGYPEPAMDDENSISGGIWISSSTCNSDLFKDNSCASDVDYCQISKTEFGGNTYETILYEPAHFGTQTCDGTNYEGNTYTVSNPMQFRDSPLNVCVQMIRTQGTPCGDCDSEYDVTITKSKATPNPTPNPTPHPTPNPTPHPTPFPTVTGPTPKPVHV